MKKTLIAILALGSVALAADPAPWTPDQIQQEFEKQMGMYPSFDQGFQLTFAVHSTAELNNTYYFLTLDDNFTLTTQVGQYVGFADKPATPRGGSNINHWAYDNTQGVDLNVDSEHKTITLTQNNAYSMVWFSYGLNGQNIQKASTALAGAEFVVTVKDGNTTVSMRRPDGVVDNMVMKDYVLDPEKISFEFKALAVDKPEGNPSILYRPDLKIAPIPEPATGSLSLLALAGLCARRRKK